VDLLLLDIQHKFMPGAAAVPVELLVDGLMALLVVRVVRPMA